MATYAEKLRDPRWQRRRLERLASKAWTCQDCGDQSRELHVHHAFYEPRRDPWDYPDRALLVLCNGCHISRHMHQKNILEFIGQLEPEKVLAVEWFIAGLFGIDVEQAERKVEHWRKHRVREHLVAAYDAGAEIAQIFVSDAETAERE